MKKKYILQSGLIGKFRNGTTFVSSYLAGIGHIVTTSEGAVVQVTDNWDEKTLIDIHFHEKDSPYDILALWKPTDLLQLSSCLKNTDDPVFKTEPVWKSKQTKTISEEVNTMAPTIRTTVSLQINGKDVDLNNLSDYELAILINFGLI